MLHAVAHGLCLKKLGRIEKGVKIVGIEEGLAQVVHDLSVGRLISLVFLHDIGENVPVPGLGEGLDGL